MVYLIVFIFTIFGWLTNNRMSKSLRVLFLFTIGCYIILLMGLRYRVGIDTINYMNNFNHAPSLSSIWNTDFTTSRFEPGYMILCAFCKDLIGEYWLVQLIHSIVLIFCTFTFLYRYCFNVFVGIFVFLIVAWLYFNTEVIRESFAISIFLLNYENLKNKNWGKYYLYCLLSISFQYSAIILLFFPLFSNFKLNKWFIICCIGLLFIFPIADTISKYITIASISSRIDKYLANADTLNLNWRLANLIKTFLAIGAYIIAKKYNIKSSFEPYILLYIFLSIGAFSIPIIFSRFCNYELIFLTVYCANIISLKRLSHIVRLSLICLIFISYTHYYTKMWSCWIPYVSIFQNTKITEREQLWWQYNH